MATRAEREAYWDAQASDHFVLWQAFLETESFFDYEEGL
jgi:hypothetical protein